MTNGAEQHTFEIETTVRKVSYNVAAHVTLSCASAKLSEGSTFDKETNSFTVKAIDGELKDLYRPYIRLAVKNVKRGTKLYFEYANLSDEEAEIRIRLKNIDGTNVEVSTNYCKGNSSRKVAITFANDIDWSNVAYVEISFDNVVLRDGAYVLAPDRHIGMSDLWLDVM